MNRPQPLGLRSAALGLVFFVTGCAGVAPTISQASATLAPTKAAALTITSTVVRSSPTLAVMATPTPTRTNTPVPTLSANEAQVLVLELLEHNAGCRLPCWWGFVPDKTTWREVQDFLLTFALQIQLSGSSNDPFQVGYVKFLVPEEIYPTPLRQTYIIRNGRIETIEVQLGYVSRYGLSYFLSTYGQPAEIWLRTYRYAREDDLPFDLVLFYPEQGILARFYSQATSIANNIEGCPQQRPAAVVALWSSERRLTFSEATSQTIDIRNEIWWPYRLLQEATGMDIETFYQTFKNSNNAICLETPADLWPQP